MSSATSWDISIVDAIGLTNQSFAPHADAVATDARRAALLRVNPTLHAAWLRDLDQLEPKIAAWIASRTGGDPASIETRAAATALVATHRLLVESWKDGDIATYLDSAERALSVLRDGITTLEPHTARS